MTIIETEEKKMPEGTNEQVKQQQGGHLQMDKVESVVPAWLQRESARLVEKHARENKEAGERMHARVEARQAAIREDTLSIYRLNKANRERPIHEAMERARLEVEEAGRLARERKPQPRKNLLARLNEFMSQPNEEVKRLREVEGQSYDAWKGIARAASKRLGKGAEFLRGVATSTYNYLNNTNLSIRLEKKLGTKPAQPTGARTPGTSGLLNR